MVGAKTYKSQSQRLAALAGGDNKSSRTAPGASGLPGFGSLPGSKKLNTPTKKPFTSSSAQGAGAGAGPGGGRASAQASGSAQANGTAGKQHAEASVWDFPDDDENEEENTQKAIAQQRLTNGALAGPAGKRPGAAGAASAGTAKPKGLVRNPASRQLCLQDGQADQAVLKRPLYSFLPHANPPAAGTPGLLSALDNSTKAAGKAAIDETAAGTAGPARQQQPGHGGKQLGIRQFARSMPPGRDSNGTGPLPAGMLNHGNTCYLNAILQALLSLPSLAQDLNHFNRSTSSVDGGSSTAVPGPGAIVKGSSSDNSLSQLQLPPDGVTAAIVACLRQYQSACRAPGDFGASSAAISPKVVREAMKKRASHWGAARQEDAHEFFTALLNALADEVQQAQLEHMQHSSSCHRRKQRAAAIAAPPITAEAAAGAAANGALELPPSANDAAQACQADRSTEGETAAAVAAPTDNKEDEKQKGAEQQQRQRESSPAADDAEPGSRQSTPACQLPSMSVSQALCPVTRNFLGCLQHTYTCSVCGKSTVQKEQFNHLILDLPQDEDSGSNGLAAGSSLLCGGSNGNRAPVADLSSLLANHFNPETCEKACEGCGASAVQHRVEHAIRRLPRVLVVQLKRFKWVISPGGIPDCRKMPTPVQPDKQLFLGRLCVPGRPVPPLLAALMPQRLLRTAMEAAGEQPPQQQQKQQFLLTDDGTAAGRTDDHSAAPATAAAAAAAVADGGLASDLPATTSDTDAAAPGQQQDQQQQKPASKRLGNLRPGFAQPVKKPKVVDGQAFDAHKPNGSLASFWHVKPAWRWTADPSKAPTLHRRASQAGTSPLGQQQRQQRPASPDLLTGPWGDKEDTAAEPFQLRRNNSSSAVPQVDLTGLADAAAADSDYDRDLAMALALSMQEQHPQQQQQQQGDSSAAAPVADDAEADRSGSEDAEVPELDDQTLLPSWMMTHHVPSEAAAPPASPVHSTDSGAPGAAAGNRALHDPAAWGPYAFPKVGPITIDSICALTPASDTCPKQQQQGSPMDIDEPAGQVPALFEGLAPASPAQQAPRPDRSGRVSSSTAPGGSQQRPAGQKLGGGQVPFMNGNASAAAAAAALQRLGNNPQQAQPQLLQDVQAAGLSEEEQINRAIEESMREQQQPQPAGDQAAGAVGNCGDADRQGEKDKPVVIIPEPMAIDITGDDEETALQRALAESAAAYERQQQEQLQLLQQQEDAEASLLASAAAAGHAPAAAAAGDASAEGGSKEAGAAAAAAAAAGQRVKKERPPALLLRLLEDSDYEAEQDELQGRGSKGNSSSRSSSPGSDAATDEAAVAADGDRLPAQPKQRKGRSRKQQKQDADAGAADASAAAGADGGRKQRAYRSRSQAAAAAGTAGSIDAADAAAPAMELCEGLEGDKENVSVAAAGLDAGAAADTAAVPDRGTRAAAAAAIGKGGQQQKQRQRRALGEILGSTDSSARNAAAGAAAAAAAAGGQPPQKPPTVAAAVAAAQAAAAGSNGAAAGSNAAAAAEGGEVQELQEGVAAGAVGTWPQDAAASYSLSAVVRHMGDMVSAGHFTSDVYNHEAKRWFHYDDSQVQALASIETVARLCQRDGYLFFYVNDAISDS